MQSQVIICDQQSVYAIGSARLVENHPKYRPAKIIDSLLYLNEMTNNNDPNVLVVDSSMFDFNHPQSKDQINTVKNKMPVMIVLNSQDDSILYQLIDHGFSVIVSRNASEQEWLKGLEMVKQDKVYFCKEVADKVLALSAKMDNMQIVDKVNQLSVYDKYILIRICEEAPSKQIASELKNSKRTIEGHRTKMMQLFDVKNVAGLVKIACTTNLYQHYLSNPGLYELTLCAKTSSL